MEKDKESMKSWFDFQKMKGDDESPLRSHGKGVDREDLS